MRKPPPTWLEIRARVLPGCACGRGGHKGQPERAARVFGAGQALRQSLRANLARDWPGGARSDYEQDVATVRAQLDAATFEAAWAAGRAMTLEQAIAEALGEGG